ncbi:MAG: DUF2064 domain-containing protein [Rhodospirillales bacterium]|nr:DUF2064 domain-containing protein [Rhodospirillales bacterium]
MSTERGRTCVIGVMAKAPQPGRSKTRLCPPLSAAEAAALSAAFLRDITENVALAGRSAAVQGCVTYAPAGAESLFDGHLAPGTGLLLADGAGPVPPGVEGFGRCLLHAAQGLLAQGYGAVCLVNSDSPTLPTDYLLRAAILLLAPGKRVVLGPAEDGGYYLIGMKAPYADLFRDIAWSSDGVADATRARVAKLGLELVELPLWYDVDDAEALARLQRETHMPPPDSAAYTAPATCAVLDTLRSAATIVVA